jgi:hypothetical protein
MRTPCPAHRFACRSCGRLPVAGAALPGRRLAAALLMAAAVTGAAAQEASPYGGRPVYSEPGTGLQMPPGCQLEPTWRGRMASGDLEVWIVSCNGDTRTWLVRRSIVEMKAGNQARLRFQVLDDRVWPGETAGDSASVQCTGRAGGEAGYVVLGARWRQAGSELRLAGAQSVIRADPAVQRFVPAQLAQVDCVRHPEREAMLRRLQQGR